jgi:hypothetical protein
MKIIVSHPSSNQFSRAMLRHLLKNKDLIRFYKAIVIFPSQLIYKLSRLKAFNDITCVRLIKILKNIQHQNHTGEIVSNKYFDVLLKVYNS